jgi:hypothetical protein
VFYPDRALPSSGRFAATFSLWEKVIYAARRCCSRRSSRSARVRRGS